jgi:hypothetical protein
MLRLVPLPLPPAQSFYEVIHEMSLMLEPLAGREATPDQMEAVFALADRLPLATHSLEDALLPVPA